MLSVCNPTFVGLQTEIELNVVQMGTETEQDPNNYRQLRESVLRAFKKSGY